MIHLDLPLPPLGNHRNGVYVPAGGAARWYPTKETKQYRRLVQLTCLARGVRPIAGPVAVRVVVRRPPKGRGDLDGYLKTLLDHLQGHAYRNDSQIQKLEAELVEDDAGPRCEVDVEAFQGRSV